MAKRAKVLCPACGTESFPEEGACQKCGLSLPLLEPDSSEYTIVCPRCQHINNTGSFFCYSCGKYFADIEKSKKGWGSGKRKRSAPSNPALKAKVVMPGGAEILLTGIPVFIERSDFDSTLSHDLLMNISRQHVLITYGKGKYFVQDYGHDGKGSTNHTRLNGSDIYKKRKKALKDGDEIELAGQQELTMMFKLLR